MAQSWRVYSEPNKKPRRPLDQERLERLGLYYVGRFSTTRAKLCIYLARKVKERGWEGDKAPDVEALAEKFSKLGYIDDRAFAASRAASLQRRGFGVRRIDQALKAAGIEAGDAAPAQEAIEEGAWAAALKFAQRKRIGPYAAQEPDREVRQKAFAAMMRAGHPMEIVQKVLNCRPGELPEPPDLRFP